MWTTSPSLTLTRSVGSESEPVIAMFWYGAMIPARVSVGVTDPARAAVVAIGTGAAEARARPCVPAAFWPQPANVTASAQPSATETNVFMRASSLRAEPGDVL